MAIDISERNNTIMPANTIDLRLIATRQIEIQLSMQEQLASMADKMEEMMEKINQLTGSDTVSEYTLNGSSSSEEEEEEVEAPAAPPEQDMDIDIPVD